MSAKLTGFASVIQSLEAAPRRLRDSAAQAGFIVQRELVESTMDRVNSSGTSTGALAGSWEVAMVSAKPGSFTFGVFSDLPYARIHEAGGVIRPVRAKALAVPVTKKARRMGPREWPEDLLQYVPVNRHPVIGLLALKGRGTRKGKAQYLLLKEANIKPTLYITKAREAAMPQVAKHLSKAMMKAVGG